MDSFIIILNINFEERNKFISVWTTEHWALLFLLWRLPHTRQNFVRFSICVVALSDSSNSISDIMSWIIYMIPKIYIERENIRTVTDL
jgi:hypothetical protein